MQRENWGSMKLRDLNEKVGSRQDFYNRLCIRGYYLPKIDKSCITAEYLYGVMTDKFFCVLRENIKMGFPLIKASKIDLFGYLAEAVSPKALGFKLTQLPNREWMETVLFSIQPGHLIFKKPPMLIPEREFEVPQWLEFISIPSKINSFEGFCNKQT